MERFESVSFFDDSGVEFSIIQIDDVRLCFKLEDHSGVPKSIRFFVDREEARQITTDLCEMMITK
jgi:hypothetical protein